MATRRPHALLLVIAPALTAFAAVTTTVPAPAASHATQAAPATCSSSTDWNTMVPEGQCPAYRS
ncbi:hypothetical protein [Catenulispora subtropica]|uniref:Uncharacterized protein n=1 Tax=Catenulispora subtropica TaxID=450798 RepID=A0ABP5EM40_9ACTN